MAGGLLLDAGCDVWPGVVDGGFIAPFVDGGCCIELGGGPGVLLVIIGAGWTEPVGGGGMLL